MNRLTGRSKASVRLPQSVLAAAIALASIDALAASPDAHIPRAVETIVTDEGLRRLERDTVGPFLAELGIDSDHHEIPSWDFESASEVSLDTLPAEFLRYRATFKDLADLIGNWLFGFDMKAPRPAAHADKLWYEVQPAHLGIHALRRGEDGWLNARFEASFEWFQAEVERVSMVDRANDWLGEFALIEAALKSDPAASGGEQLFFSVQFSFRLKPGTRDFEIRIDSIRNNFGSTPIELNFKDIVLPQIEISIGNSGSRGASASVQLKDNVLNRRNELIGSLQVYLERYARTRLAGVLNEELKTRWKDILAFSNEMSPPGLGEDEIVAIGEGFTFDYLPSELDFDPASNQASIVWDVRVTDLLNPGNSAPSRAYADRGRTDFSVLGKTDFDLGLSLNPDLITHAVDLSLRNRSLFQGIADEPDAKRPTLYRLVSAPVFEGVVEDPQLGRLWKARLTLGATFPGGAARLFENREARLEVTALIHPKVRGSRSIDIELVGLDLADSRLDPASIRKKFLSGLIRTIARGELKKQSRSLKEESQVLYTYDLLPTYLGVPVRLCRTAIDSKGHLVVALDQIVHGPLVNRSTPSARGGAAIRKGDSK